MKLKVPISEEPIFKGDGLSLCRAVSGLVLSIYALYSPDTHSLDDARPKTKRQAQKGQGNHCQGNQVQANSTPGGETHALHVRRDARRYRTGAVRGCAHAR